MFLASYPKPIDPQLRELVEQIEKQSPAEVSILAARQFRYSIYQTPVEVTVSEPRKLNVLEEFILRAGIELSPPPTTDELATVLGLDPVFVRNTTKTLRALQTLEVMPEGAIALTPQGREFYEQGSVPQEPELKQIYAIADPLLGTIFFLNSPLEETPIDLPNLENFIAIENRCANISELPLEEIQRLIQASGLGLQVPEDGKNIAEARIAAETQTIWQSISVFVSFDALEDKVTVQVRRGKKILQYPSDLLDILQSEGIVSLKNLCELSDEAIALERDILLNQRNQVVEARLEKIQQQAIETTKILRATGNQASTEEKNKQNSLILLRDSQIRDSFLETLNKGNQDIIIYSPWVSQEVVDAYFIQLLQNLANRGVWILIGHGIARRQEDETKPISPQVEAKLREIKTPEGLPAVQIFWLGNSHAKEVIIDRKVHLCGSHNWLSYRGDRLPRGETVYKVTLSDRVREAYEFLADRFHSHAQKLWDEAVLKEDYTLAIQPLCVWGALSMEDKALNQLQQNNWLELLPFWLKVVCQGLRSKKISPDSAYFKTALSLLSQISAETSYIEALREGWQQVMGAIASYNSNTALALLNDEVWEQFLRLEIAPSPINSPAQFISKYTNYAKKHEKISENQSPNTLSKTFKKTGKNKK